MKKTLQTLLLLVLMSGVSYAQFSPNNLSVNINLNRGVSPANDTTASGASAEFYESPYNASAKGRFFPNITGSAYKLRAICANSNGDFGLIQDTLSVKNAGSFVAKTIVYGIANADAIAKFSFKLNLKDFTAANPFLIAIGNATSTGRILSSLSTFTSAKEDIFGSLKVFLDNGVLTTQYRSADGANAINTAANLITPGSSLQTVEIFANSSTAASTYTYLGVVSPIALAANTYHVYINGVKHAESFPKAGTSYVQPTLNSIAFSSVGGTLLETIKIFDISVTYPAATLPVSLTSFTGQKENTGIRLNWKTASELNNSHFDILRSTDGKNFATLTSVSGNGTSQQTHTYSYLDATAEKGTNYYKLKQVDNDGTAKTSDIVVAVDNALSAQQAFSIRFNGSNELNAQFDASASGAATIIIRDLSGRTVVSQSFNAQKGANNINLQIPSLTAGIYVATLAQNDQINSIKIIK